MYENKKILILGAARSGIAIAKFLQDKHNDLTISDVKALDKDVKKELESLGIKVIEEKDQLDLIDNSYDLIIKNPAIMDTSLVSKKIRDLNVRCENEMEVAYHFIPQNVQIIGITGSNGKTTTTTLVYELLKRLNVNVVLGGNIGYPLASVVKNLKENDVLLLEISDHQLNDFNDFKTNISVLLNICPTHLDYHGTYEHYKWTKAKIFNHHTSNDIAIINKQNDDCLEVSKDIKSNKIYFNDENNYIGEDGIYIDKEKVIDLKDIFLKGRHNYEDILASLLVVKRFSWDPKVIGEFLKNFGGVEHRQEFVREYQNIKFYNDSKATNPTATINALKTFQEPILLILGGQERNQDFNELNSYMNYVKKIYAIGTVTSRVVEYAKSIHKEVEACYKLNVALEKIKEDMVSGDVVLLSTASASQDQYVKFEDRGEEFKKFVANL